MEQIEQRKFIGMNQDDSYQNIPNGDYIYALNVEIGTTGVNVNDFVSNMLGNTNIGNPAYPSGTNTIIGITKNDTQTKLIYFVHNSSGNHTIWQYYNGVHSKLLEWSGLNFSLSYPIIDTEVINNLLYWTDNNNRPRRLNLDKANPDKPLKIRVNFAKLWAYSAGAWNYNNNPSATATLTLRFSVNGTTDYSYAYGASFTSWVTDYYTFIAGIASSINAGYPALSFSNKFSAEVVDDYILLTGRSNTYYDLSVYSSLTASPTTPVTNVIHTWVVYENAYPTPYIEEQFTLHRPTPTAPIVNTIWSNTNNELNPKENSASTVKFAFGFKFFDGEESVFSPHSKLQGVLVKSDVYYTAIDVLYPIGLNTTTYLGFENEPSLKSDNYVQFFSEIEKVIIYAKYDLNDWGIYDELKPFPNFYSFFIGGTSLLAIASTTANAIEYVIPAKAKTLQLHSNRLFLGNNTDGKKPVATDIKFTCLFDTGIFDTEDIDFFLKPQYYKRGGRYKFGIVYYDKFGRPSPVYTNANMEVYIAYYYERFNKSKPFYDTAFADYIVATNYSHDRVKLKFEVLSDDSVIPDWAHSYQLVRTTNLKYQYFRSFVYALDDIKYVSGYPNLPDGTPDYENPNLVAYTSTTIQEIWFNYIYDAYDFFPQEPYNFQEGDRLRLANVRAGGVYYEFDAKILRQSGSYIIIDNKDVNLTSYDYSTSESGGGPTGEIWQATIKNASNNFFEIGERFTVDNPETVSKSFGTTSATIADGDISSNRIPTRFEDMHLSPAFSVRYWQESPNKIFWHQNLGRIMIKDDTAKEEAQKGTNIRFSNLYVQNGSNGLSSFEALNQKDYAYNEGQIQRMIRVNEVLLVIQEKLARSIYVSKRILRDTEGQELVAITTEVIGDDRVLTAPYGTANPESVVVASITGENEESASIKVYWWDVRNGVVARYGADGLAAISDFKMNRYFQNKANKLRINETPGKVVGGFDPYFKRYYLSFPDITISATLDEAKITVVFDELNNRFRRFMDIYPSFYLSYNTQFFSVLNNLIYEHNKGTTWNRWYEGNKTAEIKIILNQQADIPKNWLNLALDTDSLWEAVSITNEKGQESELLGLFDYSSPSTLPADFENKEGVFYAGFLRDKNTPNVANTTDGLNFGEELQSQYLIITLRLKNPNTVFSQLRAVNVGYNKSVGHLLSNINS
ncbi:MAG: hypothetical protein ACRC78_21655 [Planktothrix sp.]